MAIDNNLNHIKEMLQQHDVRPSLARVRIYEYLQKMKNHPTVDTIYAALLPSLASLSRTTVYNTLNLFVEKGIVQAVYIEEEQVRYDAEVSTHGHFKCLCCGEVYDFPLKACQDIYDHLEPGFQVMHTHLYSYGICNKCQKKSCNLS